VLKSLLPGYRQQSLLPGRRQKSLLSELRRVLMPVEWCSHSLHMQR
jgi:hypothetical protein